MKPYCFGWYGDGGLGEKSIQLILSGRKTATSCPVYDPEDAELVAGEELALTDKHGTERARLVVTHIEVRSFGSFDEALAQAQGVTLPELRENISFANGRSLRDDEEMRVVHFRVLRPAPAERR